MAYHLLCLGELLYWQHLREGQNNKNRGIVKMWKCSLNDLSH